MIEQILEEEEQLINGHRKHIDEMVDLVKGEMSLLNDVDKPGSDASQYVANLDKLILQKIDMMHQIRQQLIDFHTHLKTEELMAKLYEDTQNVNNPGQQQDETEEMYDDQGQNDYYAGQNSNNFNSGKNMGGYDDEDMLLNGDDGDINDFQDAGHIQQLDRMDYMEDDQEYNYEDNEAY